MADVLELMDALESQFESARSEFRVLLVEADALNAAPSLLAEWLIVLCIGLYLGHLG